MKKKVMFIAAMMISSIIFAQTPGKDPTERANRQTERMKEVLDLSDAQYASIKSINKKYAEKQSEFRKEGADAREQRHSAMKDLHQQKQKEISEVLSLEQKAKWDSHKKEQRKGRNYRARSSGFDSEKMKTELSLSDTQVAKIREANAEFKKKAADIRGSSDQESANRDEYKKLRTEHDTAMKSILTPDQYKKWRLMKEERQKKSPHKRKVGK